MYVERTARQLTLTAMMGGFKTGASPSRPANGRRPAGKRPLNECLGVRDFAPVNWLVRRNGGQGQVWPLPAARMRCAAEPTCA
jgi:hypothetical protein